MKQRTSKERQFAVCVRDWLPFARVGAPPLMRTPSGEPMTTIRQMALSELGRIGEIDRSEAITQQSLKLLTELVQPTRPRRRPADRQR